MRWNLTKKDNDHAIDSLRNNISDVFDDFFSMRPSMLFETEWNPTIDIVDNDTAINVRAEVPGIDEKDLRVSLENNLLTIAGEKTEEKKEEGKNKKYVISERKFGSFQRSISLPDGIKADKIEAVFKNGVLKIDIPKDEKVKPTKINIDVK